MTSKLPTLFDFEKNFDSWLVGYNRLFNDLEDMHDRFLTCKFPAHDLTKYDNGDVKIELAVAGYSVDDLAVETDGNKLTVRGEKIEEESTEEDFYKHKGIATRKFERTFPVAGEFEIGPVELDNGLLSIGIKRDLEETSNVVRHKITTK